jgi:hypothetical protein
MSAAPEMHGRVRCSLIDKVQFSLPYMGALATAISTPLSTRDRNLRGHECGI